MRRWLLFMLSALVFLNGFSLSNCEIGLPVIPVNLSSPRQTYSSVDLDWEIGFANNDSSDYESDIEATTTTTFIVVFSPPATENCGCCLKGTTTTCVTNLTNITVTGLQFGVNYTFTVYANGTEEQLSNTDDDYSSIVSVITPGNVAPSFSNVKLCMHYNEASKQTQLISHVMPCPLTIPDPNTTPPVIGYELQVSGLAANMIKSQQCVGQLINVTEGRPYIVRATAFNAVGLGNTTVSNKFHASWLRNISIQHMNNTLRVHYDTASCVVNKGLKILLSLSVGHFSSINYNSDDKVFVIYNIEQTTPLVITLQVVDPFDKDVGKKHIIRLNQPPTGPPPPNTEPTIAVPTKNQEDELSLQSLRTIIGTLAGMILFLIFLLISMFFVLRKVSKIVKSKLKVEKEEFEYLSPKSRQDSSAEPSTSPSISLSLSDVYEDLEIHKQNPACVWVPDYEEVVTNISSTSVL